MTNQRYKQRHNIKRLYALYPNNAVSNYSPINTLRSPKEKDAKDRSRNKVDWKMQATVVILS